MSGDNDAFEGGFATTPDFHPSKPPTAVKSAMRVLRVFEYFLATRQPARARDIAGAIDMPQSSTSMLLRSLVDSGYLDYDARDRTYLPTMRVTLMGAWLDTGPIRDGRLIAALEQISDRTLAAVVVATRIGIFSHYIFVIQGRTPLRFNIAVGTRRLLARSGSGTALMLDLPDDEIAAIVRRSNSEVADTQLDPKTVIDHVRQSRRKGYAYSRELVTRGSGFIAMPLPSELDSASRRLAVGVGGTLEDFDNREDEIVTAIRQAIDGLGIRSAP